MLKSLTFSYDSLVYEDISMDTAQGITAIAGQSGCGKTTLLRTIAGLITPDSGSVGTVGKVGMVFQEPRLFPWFTVERNLKSVLKSLHLSKAEMDKRIDSALKTVGLEEYKKHFPSELSGGMKMRVSIARALVYESETLLLDEPFNGLDVSSKKNIIQLLRSLAEDGLRMVFVSHIPEDIIDIADMIYILSPRPARVIDSFENTLLKSKRYKRQQREIMINRIKSSLGVSSY